MASWFAGEYSRVHQSMSYLARVMDGTGLATDSGSHGQRGYEGDYRFSLIAATTPLEHRAWEVMGTVGNRLVFHEMPRQDDINTVARDIFEDREYGEKVERCQATVSNFLSELWEEHGGYGSVDWTTETPEEVQKSITYLTKLITHARAPTEESRSREGYHRVMDTLRNIARGRALLNRRKEITMVDVEVCTRLALSTMHRERRGIVKAVVDPEMQNPMTSTEIMDHDATEATKKTIIKRMERLEKLGIGETMEEQTGRNTKEFVPFDDFVWPDELAYPRFE